MSELKKYQKHYQEALNKYQNKKKYNYFLYINSIAIITLQLFSITLLLSINQPFHLLIISAAISYISTDFINGLIHMYMDNNHNYTSIFGPYIAAFHQHHVKIKYTEKSLLAIYFFESGFKFWLAPVLTIVCFLAVNNLIPEPITIGLILFCFFSSFAEVSHFICHNRRSPSIRFLQKIRILLPVKHHMKHHKEDNKNYAFLNGISDRLINWIAKRLYVGYKKTTDLHTNMHSNHNEFESTRITI